MGKDERFDRLLRPWMLAVALVIGFSPQAQAKEGPEEEDGCTKVMRGYFAAPDTSTAVSMGMCPDDRYLQFEDGPKMSLQYADYLGESYKCKDADTGLDHIVLETACLGSRCVPDYGVYVTNAEKQALDHVFSIEFPDHEWLHRPLITDNGDCLWRGIAKAEAALDAALAPLLVGRTQNTDPWALKPNETLALSPHRLPTEVIVAAFGAIGLYGTSTVLPSLSVSVQEAEYLSDVVHDGFPDGADIEPGPKARAAFQVLQVTRHAPCGSAGVLLVEDMRDRTWIALRDFGPGGCDEGATYGFGSMEFLYVRDDKLYARGEGLGYGGSWFEIDLRSHTAKRLPKEPQFIKNALAGLSEKDVCAP